MTRPRTTWPRSSAGPASWREKSVAKSSESVMVRSIIRASSRPGEEEAPPTNPTPPRPACVARWLASGGIDRPEQVGYHPAILLLRGGIAMAVSVGFIGVGNMGNPMAGNVLKAGFPMTVFDKSAAAMDNLVQAGARAGASMADVAERSEIVLTCLPASPDVEALYLEPAGLIERAKPGTILIDLSSVLPSTPRKLEPRARARGVHFLEAPVSGGVAGARAATLAIMVGGDAQVLERARPVLRAIGPNIFSVGPVGAGNTVKAINNMMACVNSLAMMEGVVLGVKAGLDPMIVYEVVKASSGGSKALERIPAALVPRKFEPGFKVQLMNKDLETFNTIAKELHVPVSFANVAQRYQQAALAAGLADMDTSAVVQIIERLAAVQVSRPGAASMPAAG
ncbi:MAG: NAD(P)-dependent oxidoreductase [Candidatus Rokuibacteriota bacterium]|nr:MAG: NAD(P)-dependent oxidoreductase [Candidatus Rokubacteria bacterium]